jgi:hypothetical protein
MSAYPFSFRALFSRLNLTEDPQAYRYFMMPWQSQAQEAMQTLRPYGTLEARTWLIDPAKYFDTGLVRSEDVYNSYELYALSRVSDMLLLPYQANRQNEDWIGPPVTLDERTEWFQSLGMILIENQPFCPFYHEIVEVEQASDPAEPITLLETVWPGFMLDHLLICRAGVKVRGGAQHIRKDLAETSTLCQTYWRISRPTDDASHGWGSNSQWATTFRRDYVDATTYYYNVDGRYDLNSANVLPDSDMQRILDEQGLTITEMIELVRHRCFILTDKDNSQGGLWPDPFRYREPKGKQ